jgi:hypothetical protein
MLQKKKKGTGCSRFAFAFLLTTVPSHRSKEKKKEERGGNKGKRYLCVCEGVSGWTKKQMPRGRVVEEVR